MSNLADLAVNVESMYDSSGLDDAADAVDGFEEQTSSVASFVEDNFAKMGAAAAGIGAGLEGFARSQQDTNVGFERMGRVTGEGADAMRDMATDLQNVTFPMEDVVALMETATQRGLEGDAIAEYATFWDMVGDATGEAGPALGEAGVALGLVGIKAGEEAEALDAFGYITDQTTGSVEGFLGFIERTAGELGDATPNVNDMAGALGALEDSGLSSQRAQRELRTALKETDGDMVAALETLGVSESSFNDQVTAVEASSGAIEANAAAYADSFTPMQEMSAQLENVMTKYGGLASVAGAVSAPLAGVGSAMMGLSMVAPGLVSSIGTVVGAIGTKVAAMASWAAATVAQGARAVGSLALTAGQFIAHYTRMAVASLAQAARMAASWVIAMGPVGWVIAAVVALVAVIIANWDTVVEWTRKAFDWVMDKIGAAWDWITGTTSAAVDAVVGFFTSLRDRAQSLVQGLRDRVVGFFGNLRDRAISIVSGLVSTVVGRVLNLRDRAVGHVTDLKDRVVGFFADMKSNVIEAATGAATDVIAAFLKLKDGAIEKGGELLDWVRELPGRILSGLGNLGSMLTGAGREILQSLWDGFRDKWEAVKDWVGGLGDRIKDLKGPIEADRKLLVDEGGAIMDGLGKGLAAGWVDNERMLAAMGGQIQGAFSGGVRVPGVSSMAVGGDGSSAADHTALLARIARAVEDGTDWDRVARNIGRETAREQQIRQRVG